MNPRIEVIGSVTIAAPWIAWARQRHSAEQYGISSGGSGIIIEIRPNFIRIVVTIEGIIIHPRAGTVEALPYQSGTYDPVSGTRWEEKTMLGIKGGWRDGSELLNTPYLYPLVDEDDASFLLNKDGDIFSGEFLEDIGNYGNLYWIGSDNSVISWKGTPTRHFELSELINIPGFSTHHKNFVGDITGKQPRYSAFGPNIYIEGEIIEGPKGALHSDYLLNYHSIILGAARRDGSLYCVAAGSKESTPRTYLQLWKQGGEEFGGWELLYEIDKYEDVVVNLPWFADPEGKTFICTNGATLSETGFTDRIAGTGTATLAVADSYPTAFAFNGSYPLFHEPGLQAVVSFSAGGSSTRTTGQITTKDFAEDGPIWQLGTDPEIELSGPSVLTGTGSYPNITVTAGQQFTANGGTAPYSFSASFAGTVSGSTFTTTGGDKPCGMGTIAVTDACGKTASLDVRMPNGRWINITTLGIQPSFVPNPANITINTYYYYGDMRMYFTSISLPNWFPANASSAPAGCGTFIAIGSAEANGYFYEITGVSVDEHCSWAGWENCYVSGVTVTGTYYESVGICSVGYNTGTVDTYIPIGVQYYVRKITATLKYRNGASGLKASYLQADDKWYYNGYYWYYNLRLATSTFCGSEFVCSRYYQQSTVDKWVC